MTWRHSSYQPSAEQVSEYRRRAAVRHRRERAAERAILEANPRSVLGRQRRHSCAFATCPTSVGADDLLCPRCAQDVPPADLAGIKALWFEGTVREYMKLRERVMLDLHLRHGVRIEQAS